MAVSDDGDRSSDAAARSGDESESASDSRSAGRAEERRRLPAVESATGRVCGSWPALGRGTRQALASGRAARLIIAFLGLRLVCPDCGLVVRRCAMRRRTRPPWSGHFVSHRRPPLGLEGRQAQGVGGGLGLHPRLTHPLGGAVGGWRAGCFCELARRWPPTPGARGVGRRRRDREQRTGDKGTLCICKSPAGKFPER